MAELEQRLDALLVVPLVADLKALGVVHLADLGGLGRVVEPLLKTPGYWALFPAPVGRSASGFGKVTGSLPDGLTSPNSRLAIAVAALLARRTRPQGRT